MTFATIRNNYHGSSARVRVGRLSPATVRRVRRILCGMTGCTCGGNLGERGRQEVEILEASDAFVVLPYERDDDRVVEAILPREKSMESGSRHAGWASETDHKEEAMKSNSRIEVAAEDLSPATRAILEAGEYITDEALAEIRASASALEGREGWWLDEDGHSHYGRKR